MIDTAVGDIGDVVLVGGDVASLVVAGVAIDGLVGQGERTAVAIGTAPGGLVDGVVGSHQFVAQVVVRLLESRFAEGVGIRAQRGAGDGVARGVVAQLVGLGFALEQDVPVGQLAVADDYAVVGVIGEPVGLDVGGGAALACSPDDDAALNRRLHLADTYVFLSGKRMLLLLVSLLVVRLCCARVREGIRSRRRCRASRAVGRVVHRDAECTVRTRVKPIWVREEIITLAARSRLSCRKLADVFNRRHRDRGMRVSKTFVADLLKRHTTQIARSRRCLKQRRYQPGPRNRVWGLDGTGKTDGTGAGHFLLGLIDHGTRRCLVLDALLDKKATTILRQLRMAIRRYGKPKAIRTDNEAIFLSRDFTSALRALGIRHQTIEPHCPWQNGRIERFFGTLKEKLDCWVVADVGALRVSLAAFRFWYKHVRTHQHLGGCTPSEAWEGIDVQRPPRKLLWFEGWGGLLQGEYLQR
nr:integrase core domain-containing protein [Oleiagrimonas citrea]